MKKPATALCAAALAASALTGLCGIRATSHDGYGGDADCWQMKRHRETMAAVTNGGAKVVFVGDSITHFWDRSRQQAKYYSKGDWRMLNLGTSGDRTEHVLWRLNEGGELDGYEAKCVVLMIGTNNAGQFPIEVEPPGDTILGVRDIIRTIRARQPNATLVLLPIFPRGSEPDDQRRVRNEIVNAEIAKFADGEKVLWCDFNEQLLTADGRVSPAAVPDYVHPNDVGYEIWHAAVKPYVAAALSDGRLPMPASRYASCLRGVRTAADRATTYPESKIRREFYGPGDWWIDRLRRNREQIGDSKGQIDVAMVGDSITHRWESDGKESYAELRKAYSVLNAGYSGDRTENVLWRLKFGGELDGYKAKCVTLTIGTNNHDPAEDVAAGIGEILAVIAKKQPQAKVVLMPIFPRGASAAERARVKNERVNELVRGFADGKRVVWLDFNAKFLDEKGDVVDMMTDRLHPNARGYAEVWLPALLPVLREACGR